MSPPVPIVSSDQLFPGAGTIASPKAVVTAKSVAPWAVVSQLRGWVTSDAEPCAFIDAGTLFRRVRANSCTT